MHGGSTPSHVAAAQRVQAEEVLRRVWNLEADPVTDTVGALQRLAGRLEHAADVIGAQLSVGEACELCGRGDVELAPVNSAVWIRTVRELRTALSEMERLGIAHRGMELAEGYGRQIEAVVRAILERLELSERQSLVLVPLVVPEELRRAAIEVGESGVGS